jgi:5,10-methylenetetrahydromethanopterin reductase
MSQRVGLYFQDKHPLRYEIEMAKYAEARGFAEIWLADARLARDCIVVMSALLTATQRIKIGSGVLPIWTRNVAAVGATFSTMWELGGTIDGQGRVLLGLGAWWEPICSRVGEKRERPLAAMREYTEALYQLFTMEEVVYQGDFVQLDRVRLDVTYGNTDPRDIPIYIGATGPKMLELSGEISDGPLLNYVVSVDYIRDAMKRVHAGATRAGRTPDQLDYPELLVCALSDEDPQAAMLEGKTLIAYYLGTEPHIMKANNVDPALGEKVQEVVGWPATEADYRRAASLVPDELVHRLMAVGTSAQCRERVAEFIAAGISCPVLYPLMDDMQPVIDAFANWTPGA